MKSHEEPYFALGFRILKILSIIYEGSDSINCFESLINAVQKLDPVKNRPILSTYTLKDEHNYHSTHVHFHRFHGWKCYLINIWQYKLSQEHRYKQLGLNNAHACVQAHTLTPTHTHTHTHARTDAQSHMNHFKVASYEIYLYYCADYWRIMTRLRERFSESK